MSLQILTGNCLETLKTLPEKSVQCCVTSPPYFGLRDYGHADQIGQEQTPKEFVASLVTVFREVWRVLADDGTLWLNIGDSYARNGGTGACGPNATVGSTKSGVQERNCKVPDGLKAKDLCLIPARLSLALQEDGWYVRNDIIWHKPNPMPESVTDRCTRSHEYIFLLTKSERYCFNAEAIKEPSVSDHDSGNGFAGRQGGSSHLPMSGGKGTVEQWTRTGDDKRNKRDVWTVPVNSFKEAHFATFPPDLIRPCILAGCPTGGTVLDPFGGSGTTGMVALELGRSAILCELNPDYVKIIEGRCNVTPGFPNLA